MEEPQESIKVQEEVIHTLI